MRQNTAMLPLMVWNDVVGDIARIQYLMNFGMLHAGNAQTFTTTLSNVRGFVNELQMLNQMTAQYQQWGTVTSNDITHLQASIGIQETQCARNAATLAVLQRHPQSAGGQMQALQAGNEMSALGVSQLQTLETMLAQETRVTWCHSDADAGTI